MPKHPLFNPAAYILDRTWYILDGIHRHIIAETFAIQKQVLFNYLVLFICYIECSSSATIAAFWLFYNVMLVLRCLWCSVSRCPFSNELYLSRWCSWNPSWWCVHVTEL